IPAAPNFPFFVAHVDGDGGDGDLPAFLNPLNILRVQRHLGGGHLPDDMRRNVVAELLNQFLMNQMRARMGGVFMMAEQDEEREAERQRADRRARAAAIPTFVEPARAPAATDSAGSSSGSSAVEVNVLSAGSTLAACSMEVDDCVVCLDGMLPGQVLKALPCKHRFHSQCIDTWLERSLVCPLCNGKL
ncbi:E3 ubiquitin protein ligase, partial [archaeon]